MYSNFEKGNYSDVIHYLDKYIAEFPNNINALCNRAFTYFQMELFRKCIKDCEMVIQKEPTCLKAYLRKGYALIKLSKKEEAKKVWLEGLKISQLHQVDLELYMELIHCLKNEDNNSNYNTINNNKESQNIIQHNNNNNLDISDTIAASSIVAEKGLVQFGVGKKEIDEKIAFGYLQVNTGNYNQGIQLFTDLLKNNSKLIAAYLGRGTAYALKGNLDKAIEDFSQAITINPNIVDSWKRRGQARAARGFDNDALADLTTAIQLDPKDSENYHQRGLVYYKQKNYDRALEDFKKTCSIDKMNKISWNHLGLCLNAIGSPEEAIEAHSKAVTLDPKFKEAWANMAQAYKDFGVYDKALQLFQKSLEIDPHYVHCYNLRALTHFGFGNHKAALEDLNKALKIDSNDLECLHLRAIVKHGLGLFRSAIEDYKIVVSARPDYFAWYQLEVARFVLSHLDKSLSEFNLDRCLDPLFKESWCKRTHPALLVRYKPQSEPSQNIPDVSLTISINNDALSIIDIAKRIGPKIQLNSPGYLTNKRQHAMCGLAVIELAQRLKDLWIRGINQVDGKSSSGNCHPHEFGWRDLYDILIKWRQYSEPNDPVWWVDLLTAEQFEEGFGSHTPMITGQMRVVRYYPMFSRAFTIMKNLIPQQCNMNVDNVKDCKDLYEIMRKDFWVVTPCYSIAYPGKILEGTRLTLQYSPPEGFEYSIRTPGTPPRWKEYDLELTYVWEQLCIEAKNLVLHPENDIDKFSDWVLTLTFYWYNFMPLSRGTAAVGYMALLAMFLAMNIEITEFVPKNMQVDWEGILTPKYADFIKCISSWLYPSRKSLNIDSLPSVQKTFPTIRSIIEVLNFMTK